MDVLAMMQGNADGYGAGLTTYPDVYDEVGNLLGPDPEQREAHTECLALEATGQVVRYIDRSEVTTGIKHIIWMPTGAPPPPEADTETRRRPPEPEPEPQP